MWEDDSRRRMRFVKNEHGSSHPEATLLEGVEGEQSGVTSRSLFFCVDTKQLIRITWVFHKNSDFESLWNNLVAQIGF